MSVCTLLSTSELVEMEDFASRLGVTLDLSFDTDENGGMFIWLGLLERNQNTPPGAGRRALTHLAELADEAGIAIRAAVLCWNQQLLDYYAEHGFVVIEEGDEDSDRNDHSIIERLPR